MSLTASMWTSVSGLLAHGEKMNVIGNNISNVNTVGYKNQRMDFQDFVYQYVGTAAGMGQVGRGTSIGIVMNDFSQGALETTTDSTDIAIQGNGFFAVKPLNNNMTYYTRAGNFRFNKDGYLVDPHGYVLQGWEIDRSASGQIDPVRSGTGIIGTGSPIDVCLDTFTCPPRHTTNMTIPVNLRYDKVDTVDDKSTDVTDPFFALLKSWDATQDPPLGTDKRAYQTTMNVYDEGGRMHKLTIYFDRVANNNPTTIDGYAENETMWEYIVTMDPSEDVRDFGSTYDPTQMSATNPDVPDKLKGLLAAGTLTFSSSGTMKDMTTFVPHTDGSDSDHWWTTDLTGNIDVDLGKWVSAPINSNGLPVIAPNFSGAAGLSQAYENGVWNQPNVNASGRLIGLDFGLISKSNSWQFMGDPDGNLPGNYVDTMGNTTELVSAAGVTRTYDAQATDSTGRYIWVSSDSFRATSPNSTAGPSGSWSSTPTGSNATQYYTQFTLGSGAELISGGITGNITTTADNPQIIWQAADNPNNGVAFEYTNGTAIVKITRGPNGVILTPAQVRQLNWEEDTSDTSRQTWTCTSGGTVITLTSDQTFSSPADITGSTWTSTGNFDPPSGQSAEYYWVGTVTGSPNVAISVKTGSSAAPSGTTYLDKGHDATELYWSDQINPSIQGTTSGSPPNDPTDPSYSTPTAPTGTWSPLMETVTRSSKYFVNGLDGAGEPQQTTTTCLGDNYYEHNGMQQDGYTYGDLRYVEVDQNGVLSASYSNGVTLQLYQIVLYDFPSKQNLRREGGNLFTETRESGVPSSGAAGTGTFGVTNGNALEQSNADLSREFVNMITTQRGFQANSKTITTVDTMLETVISMKR